MATSLCKNDLGSGSGAARYPLIGDGSDLLIVKKMTNWSSDKELIVTPSEEYYTMGVSTGQCSTYSTRPSGSYADGLTMANRLKALRDRKTVSSWNSGHKPLYYYCARSFPPYMIKYDSSYSSTKHEKYLEFGASWKALKFNLRGFPTGKCSSFNAYWRVWNPSCVHDVAQDQAAGLIHYTYAYTYLYNNAGVVHYTFDTERKKPSRCDDSGYFELNVVGIANQGKTGGQTCAAIPYDIYNAHLGVASKTYMRFGSEHIRLYAKSSSDKSAYYSDVQITGNALAALKAAAKSGSFWVHMGFNISNMTAQSGYGECMMPFSGFIAYTSRIELVLSVRMSSFNK